MGLFDYRSVPHWCHQGADDDRYGLCDWAMMGNLMVCRGQPVLPNVEIQSAARAMEGFATRDPTTDRGEIIEDVFRYVRDRGWPGDPLQRIRDWRSVTLNDVPGVIERQRAAPAWLMIPLDADGTGYDFSDGAVDRDAPGVYAHAVLVVDAGDGVTFITWAAPKVVSRRWAERYFRGFYEVEWVPT